MPKTSLRLNLSGPASKDRKNDHALNAIVTKSYDQARTEALRAESGSRDGLGLLHGLIIGIKDLEATAGIRTMLGSLLYKQHVPKNDWGLWQMSVLLVASFSQKQIRQNFMQAPTPVI